MTHEFRVGMMLPVEHAADDDIRTRLENLLEAARVAKEAGFGYLDAPQHYLAHPSQYFHCVPLLARVAAEVDDLPLCTNIIQLTLHNPVQVAEELATLDVICNGRLVVGFGKGYREDEFAAFGIAAGSRLGRFLEALELVKRLWTEDSVTHHGKHFTLENASIGIKPLQKPYPPIIIAASGDKMIKRSVHLCDGWSAAGHATQDVLIRQASMYRQALAEAGKDTPRHYRLMLETSVADTMEDARKVAWPYVAKKYAGYSSWGQDDELPEGQTFSAPVETLAEGRFNIGDVDHVIENMRAYRDGMGLSEMGVRLYWGGMPHRELLRNIELMGEQVIPALVNN